MAFYKVKYDNSMMGPYPSVLSLTLDLTEENHEEYEYPQEGWYWFDEEDDAWATLFPVEQTAASIPAADVVAALAAINNQSTMQNLRAALIALRTAAQQSV